jgi:Secretion system C-terminal sorting domain
MKKEFHSFVTTPALSVQGGLVCNTMYSCYHGAYLQDFSTIVTDQGTPDMSWNNRWGNNVGPTKVEGNGVVNFFTWYYHQSGGQDDPQPCNTNFVIALPAIDVILCPAPVIDDDQERESAFGGTVRDTIVNDPDSSFFKLAAEEAFYNVVTLDPSLLTLNVLSDIIYQEKFNELNQGNIGKYQEVKELLSLQNNTTAVQKLTAIVDQNVIEQNKKYVASLIALSFNPVNDADSDTVAVLVNIANMHPFYGGEAVYWARAVLHLDVEDELPQLRRAHMSTSNLANNTTDKIGQLFPVPANESATFVYEHEEEVAVSIVITNAYGQLLNKYILQSNEIKFSVQNMASGIYYLYVLENDIINEQHKLTVVR